MINNSWSFFSNVTAYLPRDQHARSIYLISSSAEKKLRETFVKNIPLPYVTTKLTDVSFNVKVVLNELGKMKIQVKSEQLPKKDEWYTVENLHQSTFGKLFTQLDCSMGEFKESFEPVFNSAVPETVSLVCKSMEKDYSQCFSNLKKALAWDLSTQVTVKKWIPGHKYLISSDREVIYIGTFTSRKKDPKKSIFEVNTDKQKCATVHLIASPDLTNGESALSDILNSRFISDIPEDNCIQLAYKNLSGIDEGEVLKNDLSNNFKDYWKNLFINTKKKAEIVNDFGKAYVENIKNIMDIFSIQSLSDQSYTMDPELFEELKKLITEWSLMWAIRRYSRMSCYTSSASPQLFEIRDQNQFKIDYYTRLFKEIGIDVESLWQHGTTSIDSTLTIIWTIKDISDSNKISGAFDFFTKNIECWNNRQYRYTRDIDIISPTLDSIIKKTILDDTDDTTCSIDYINGGAVCKISVKNIVDFVSPMDIELKKEILKSQVSGYLVELPETQVTNLLTTGNFR